MIWCSKCGKKDTDDHKCPVKTDTVTQDNWAWTPILEEYPGKYEVC